MTKPAHSEPQVKPMGKEGREWLPISDAPYNQEVFVKTEGNACFRATLHPDASMNEDEESCDQWVATGIHPDCWTDGACWESNAEEVPSDQPIGWQPCKDTTHADN